mgnify:CR=1 FL=1
MNRRLWGLPEGFGLRAGASAVSPPRLPLPANAGCPLPTGEGLV